MVQPGAGQWEFGEDDIRMTILRDAVRVSAVVLRWYVGVGAVGVIVVGGLRAVC